MCHASFQEMILWFPKCSIYALTRAAAVSKEQITLTSYGHGYMYLLSLFGQMGGQGRWGAGAQITPNPVVLQLGQMGCNLSLGHKLQCLQTFACLWIVCFSSLLGTPFPYTSVDSGQKGVHLQVTMLLVSWDAPSMICVIFMWKGWNWWVLCETLILEGRAA